MRYHTKRFVTNNHLSFLHTWYSMVPFCRCPPPPTDEFLKNAMHSKEYFLRFYLRKHLYTLRGWRQRFIKLAGDYWATIIKTFIVYPYIYINSKAIYKRYSLTVPLVSMNSLGIFFVSRSTILFSSDVSDGIFEESTTGKSAMFVYKRIYKQPILAHHINIHNRRLSGQIL